MTTLAKIQNAFAFVKGIRHDGKDAHAARPLIRHQNPRLNNPGITPAPPLPPRRVLLKKIDEDAEQKISNGEAQKMAKLTRFGYVLAGKKARDEKLHEKASAADSQAKERRTTNGKTPCPEAVGKTDTTTALVLDSSINLNIVKLLAEKSTDTLRSIASGHSNKPKRSRVPPLPRIPHQRMKFLTRLGSGGEGHCDLFRLHNPPRTPLAIKTLNETPDLIWHKNVKRKPLEAHILQDLLPAHPRIIRLYDYTYSPLVTRLYFEYCPLGDLQDLIDAYFTRDVIVPEGFIWHVFAQLAGAVHHLHTAARDEKGQQVQILHRDIKPNNILLSRPSGRCSSSSSSAKNNTTNTTNNFYPSLTLADFGVATPLSPSSFPDALKKPYAVGTLIFQGPEIPLQDQASDIWGLGAVIHCLAMGRPPMCKRPEDWSESRWEWERGAREVGDVVQRGYSTNLGEVLGGCLRMDPKERWWSGEVREKVARGRREWLAGGGDREGEQRLEEWALGGGGRGGRWWGRGVEGKDTEGGRGV